MNSKVAVAGVVVMLLGLLLLGASFALPQTVLCSGTTPYKSVTFTGQVTDASTMTGVPSALMSIVDLTTGGSLPNAGGITSSTGYYYSFSGGAGVPWSGCDVVQVTIAKTGYTTYQTTFTLNGNSNPNAGDTEGYNFAIQGYTPVVAGFTWSANGLIVTFTDKSTGSPDSWHWVFADGSTSSLQSPVHTYSNGGTYDVTETVTRTVDSKTSSATTLVTVVAQQQGGGSTTGQTCPTGTIGTYPNCTTPYNPPTKTTNGTSNTTTCPDGYTGTYPDCSPPKTGLSLYAEVGGILLTLVGLVVSLASAAIPGIVFVGTYREFPGVGVAPRGGGIKPRVPDDPRGPRP